MMNEEQKKPKMTNEQKTFLVRMIVFTLFGAILPFVFIAWRYDIFKFDKMSLTGFGFLAIIIVACFSLYVARTLKKCFPHTMFAQCVSGFMKVLLPLLVIFLMVNGIKDNIDAFMQSLIVVIVCEAIAIPVNPIPKFMYDHQLEQEENKMEKFFEKWKEANK